MNRIVVVCSGCGRSFGLDVLDSRALQPAFYCAQPCRPPKAQGLPPVADPIVALDEDADGVVVDVGKKF